MKEKEIIKKYFSDLAKKTHKKNPRSKEFYSMMGKKSAEIRKKKISTPGEN